MFINSRYLNLTRRCDFTRRIRRIGFLLLAAGSISLVNSANAAIVTLDNYVFDLGAAGFAGFGTIGTVGGNGVDQIIISGVGHQHLGNEIIADGVPQTGESLAVDVVTRAVAFPDVAAGLTSTGKINEIDYEMTFSLSLAATVGTVLPDGFGGFNASFSHVGAGAAGSTVDGVFYDGILEVFIDVPPNSVGDETLSNPTADGNDFLDGTLIATFGIQAGDGGVISTRTLDGSDDAIFELISALPGVILDNAGNDLGIPGILIGLTDTNFDLDPDGNGLADSAPGGGWPAPDAGGFGFSASGAFGDGYAQDDGSADLAVIPEPLSIATWAALTGLVGAAVGLRRLRKK